MISRGDLISWERFLQECAAWQVSPPDVDWVKRAAMPGGGGAVSAAVVGQYHPLPGDWQHGHYYPWGVTPSSEDKGFSL